jgi:hypothetical protein
VGICPTIGAMPPMDDVAHQSSWRPSTRSRQSSQQPQPVKQPAACSADNVRKPCHCQIDSALTALQSTSLAHVNRVKFVYNFAITSTTPRQPYTRRHPNIRKGPPTRAADNCLPTAFFKFQSYPVEELTIREPQPNIEVRSPKGQKEKTT